MRSEALFNRDQEPEGVPVEDESSPLEEARQELENLLPPPTPRRRLVAVKQATETSVKVLAQELVLALKYRLTLSDDPLALGGNLDVLALPRVRTSLLELLTAATAEAETLVLVEDGVARSMRRAQETAQARGKHEVPEESTRPLGS